MATPFFLPRSPVPPHYGELLSGAGLPNAPGPSWGGSEIDFPAEWTPEQIAQGQALALNPPSSAPPGSTTADALRFLTMRDNGALPGLPGVGGGEDSGGRGPQAPSVSPDQGIPGASNVGGTGSISNLGDLPEATEMSPPSMFDMSNLTGQQAFDAGLTALGLGFSAAAMNPLGIVTNLKDAGRIGKSISETVNPDPTLSNINAALGGAFRGSTPEAEQAFSAQRSGERSPEVSNAREDIGPAPAPTGIAPTVSEAEGGTGVSGSTSGPAGEASGTGAPGAGAGDSGDAGSAGDYGRGGRIPRRTNVGGSFKGAKKYAGGGPVNERQARLDRIRNFESKHGKVAI